jgi:hypothetical protein
LCREYRISHCLDNRLTDGGKDVSPTHRPLSTPQTLFLFYLRFHSSEVSTGFMMVLTTKFHKHIPSARLGLSEREFGPSKSVPNKNEHMRAKTVTNDRNVAQTVRLSSVFIKTVFNNFKIVIFALGFHGL